MEKPKIHTMIAPPAKFLVSVSTLFILTIGAALAENPPETTTLDTAWIVTTIGVLFIIFGGSAFYVYSLQKKFLDACIQENQLSLFAEKPAGLPEGTVRAIIAFTVVSISLFILLMLFFFPNHAFPEALSSLLGAVIGFYFGSRSGAKGEDGTLAEQVKTLKTEQDTSGANDILKDIKKGLELSKSVVNALPAAQKEKYAGIIKTLEDGYNKVNSLAQSGGLKDALAKGKEIFDTFKKDNPLRDVLAKALGTLGPVLGGTGPALAVIATVVGVGVKLVGAKYDKWKYRILDIPLSPAVLPLQPVDANTGLLLLMRSPIFKTVFAAEREGNDGPFLTKVVALINQDSAEAFWQTVKARFDNNRDHFNEGLQELRRAALDLELEGDVKANPELFAAVGGAGEFMSKMDKLINPNAEAQASLHQLVKIIEELQKQGLPVPAIFEKAQKEMGV